MRSFHHKFMAGCLLALIPSAVFAGKPQVKFGVVADIQYDPVAEGAPGNVYNPRAPHYTAGVTRLAEAVTTFNGIKDMTFVTSLGDMTDHDPMSYIDLKRVSDKLNVPLYNVMGNHDMKPLESEEELKKAMALKGLEKRYHSFVKGNVRFVILDCMDYGLRSHPDGSDRKNDSMKWYEDIKSTGATRAQKFNGGIGLEQLEWLEKELTKADRKGQYAIILCHMLLYPFDTQESLWNSIETVHLIEGHPSVKAVLCGHRHSGGYDMRNGIHYVNFKGMVESSFNRYAVVTVNTAEGRITIDGYGDETDRVLICR